MTEQKQQFLDCIAKGLTYDDMLKLKFVHPQTLRRYCNANNIPLNGSGGQNRVITDNMFKENDEESDYWLGYLASDGNLCSTSTAISFSQANDDRVMVDLFHKFCGGTVKMYNFINTAGNPMRRVTFGNKKIYNFLIEFGITPRKSNTLKLKYINGAVIRGLFDGDGHCKRDPNGNKLNIVTASPDLKDQLCALYTELGIAHSWRKDNNLHTVNILSAGRQGFYDLVYKNCTVYNPRKKAVMDTLVGNSY